jgi:hypothetical protein
VLDAPDEGLHEVAVLAGDAVALDYLGGAPGQLGDLVQLARRGADADDDAEREPECARVDVGGVAPDHAVVLQAGQPLRHGGRRQAHAPAQLGERQAGVLLQLREQAEIGVVEAILPLIRSHQSQNTVI